MECIDTNISGCYLLRPAFYPDHRGWFYESYNKRDLNSILGQEVDFVQDNTSLSDQYVLRGLHLQRQPRAQAKLVSVLKGRVLDVVVDLRKDSPTYEEVFKVELSGSAHQMLYIPRGLAHGFLCLEPHTLFHYKCDSYYQPGYEGGIRFNDPDLGIDWGVPPDKIILSEKDRQLPYLRELSL